jgi:hypothetical protein
MSGTGGFQTQAYNQPSMAIAGDFCSQNPYFTFDAGPGGLVAGAPNGVTIGLFAWVYPPDDPDGTGAIVQNNGSGPVSGFVLRPGQPGLITQYLADASMVIQQGYEMTLATGGDFWVVNAGTTQALPQSPGQAAMKAYANLATGKVTFALTGAPTNEATSTASSIAAASSTFTGSITGNVLTVTSAPTTTLQLGATLTGTAGTIPATTQIVSQLSGSVGGIGTYLLNTPENNYPSGTITATWGILTVGGSVTGTFVVGATLSGTGVAANTNITALGSGTGGAGTYYVNNNATVPSSTINIVGNVETKWVAMSSGLPGELVKISSHPLG